jgi:glucose-1-phosphate thymidylyltransferase
MKLIIPMAGRGTRLRPHTHTTPKPLLPVAGTMIVERIVETFARTLDRTIDEIVFILGDFGDEVKQQLTAMSERHDAKATFRKQDEALGTAHAVYCAEQDLEGEVIIVFADTIFDVDDVVSVEDADSVIWLKEVEDPSRFGVAVHEGDKITDFVEKPSEPISNMAIIGVYYFKEGADLKREIEYLLEHNVRGHGDEYQLTDALDRLLKDGKVFKSATVDEWLDCGTLPAWLDTSNIIVEKEMPQRSYNEGDYKNTKIIPPVYIGENVALENCVVGPYASIGEGTRIVDSTVQRSIVLTNSSISDSNVRHSTIGNHVEAKHIDEPVHLGDHSKVGQ